MLRLTGITGTPPTQIIKLEGKIWRPWVDEVRQACACGTDPSGPTSLDLSALTFVDAAGEKLLRDLIGQGIQVVACASYIAELLRASTGVRLVDPE